MSSVRGPPIRRGPAVPISRHGAPIVNRNVSNLSRNIANSAAASNAVRARTGGESSAPVAAKKSKPVVSIAANDDGSETEAASVVSDSDDYNNNVRGGSSSGGSKPVSGGGAAGAGGSANTSEYRPPAESDGEASDGDLGGSSKAKADTSGGPELLVEKKRSQKRRFTEEMLVGQCGLDRMYESFPQVCKFRGRGYEVSDLHRLVRMYEEWAHQLFPNMARHDLIDGVAKMGSKPLVRSHLMGMRDTERDRYMVEELGLRLPERSSAFDDSHGDGATAMGGDFTSPESVSQHAFRGAPAAASNGGGANMYRDDAEASRLSLPDFDEACIAALDNIMAGGAPAISQTKGGSNSSSSSGVNTPVAKSVDASSPFIQNLDALRPDRPDVPISWGTNTSSSSGGGDAVSGRMGFSFNAATPTTADAFDNGGRGDLRPSGYGEEEEEEEWDMDDMAGIHECIASAADDDENEDVVVCGGDIETAPSAA